MWIPVNEIVWALIILGGMAWILEFCCECADGRRKPEKENELEAKRKAKQQHERDNGIDRAF